METPRASSAPPSWARWALVAITVAAAAFRFPGLTAEEPWFDEVFTIVLASQDLPELWRRAVADQTNPPGYYLLLWGWTRLGGFDLAWMRLLPMLAATFTVPATALAARAVGLGRTGALVAATLAAASPMMFAMSSEIRAYSAVALVTALTLAAAADRRTAVAALGGVALVMLHYFGAFVVAALFVATLWEDRARWRAAFGLALPAALALGAWVALVVRAAGGEALGGNAGWIAPTGARGLLSLGSQVVGTFGTAAGAMTVAAALAVVLAIAARAAVRRRGAGEHTSNDRVRHAFSLATLPILLVALLGFVSDRELWVARYLIVTLPAWWLLLALAVERASGVWRETALAALLTWASLAGIHADRTRPRKTAWSHVAMALTAGGPRTVCTAESFVALPLRYQALGHEVPLTVLDLDACTAPRRPDAIILRKGTESALLSLTREGGARAGPPRDLGTRLPETVLVALGWRAEGERE